MKAKDKAIKQKKEHSMKGYKKTYVGPFEKEDGERLIGGFDKNVLSGKLRKRGDKYDVYSK